MLKLFKTIILSFFLISIFLTVPTVVLAENLKLNLQITIPGFNDNNQNTVVGDYTIGNYIIAIYKYAIGIVSILATVVLMLGGFIWLTAGGDSGRVTEGQTWIKASLTGLLLAMSSYLILKTINPALITAPKIQAVGIAEMGCCELADSCSSISKSACTGGTTKGNWKDSSYSCNSTTKKCESKGCCYQYTNSNKQVKCNYIAKESCSSGTFVKGSCDSVSWCNSGYCCVGGWTCPKTNWDKCPSYSPYTQENDCLANCN